MIDFLHKLVNLVVAINSGGRPFHEFGSKDLVQLLITKKNHKFVDKSIYFRLAFESYCFHGQA